MFICLHKLLITSFISIKESVYCGSERRERGGRG
jgi:hypothetical protein